MQVRLLGFKRQWRPRCVYSDGLSRLPEGAGSAFFHDHSTCDLTYCNERFADARLLLSTFPCVDGTSCSVPLEVERHVVAPHTTSLVDAGGEQVARSVARSGGHAAQQGRRGVAFCSHGRPASGVHTRQGPSSTLPGAPGANAELRLKRYTCWKVSLCPPHHIYAAVQLVRAAGAALRTDQQVKELGELMIRRRLFIKADRMFKKPKPGKKRLVKWPHKLVPLYDDKARALYSRSRTGFGPLNRHTVQSRTHLTARLEVCMCQAAWANRAGLCNRQRALQLLMNLLHAFADYIWHFPQHRASSQDVCM